MKMLPNSPREEERQSRHVDSRNTKKSQTRLCIIGLAVSAAIVFLSVESSFSSKNGLHTVSTTNFALETDSNSKPCVNVFGDPKEGTSMANMIRLASPTATIQFLNKDGTRVTASLSTASRHGLQNWRGLSPRQVDKRTNSHILFTFADNTMTWLDPKTCRVTAMIMGRPIIGVAGDEIDTNKCTSLGMPLGYRRCSRDGVLCSTRYRCHEIDDGHWVFLKCDGTLAKSTKCSDSQFDSNCDLASTSCDISSYGLMSRAESEFGVVRQIAQAALDVGSAAFVGVSLLNTALGLLSSDSDAYSQAMAKIEAALTEIVQCIDEKLAAEIGTNFDELIATIENHMDPRYFTGTPQSRHSEFWSTPQTACANLASKFEVRYKAYFTENPNEAGYLETRTLYEIVPRALPAIELCTLFWATRVADLIELNEDYSTLAPMYQDYVIRIYEYMWKSINYLQTIWTSESQCGKWSSDLSKATLAISELEDDVESPAHKIVLSFFGTQCMAEGIAFDDENSNVFNLDLMGCHDKCEDTTNCDCWMWSQGTGTNTDGECIFGSGPQCERLTENSEKTTHFRTGQCPTSTSAVVMHSVHVSSDSCGNRLNVIANGIPKDKRSVENLLPSLVIADGAEFGDDKGVQPFHPNLAHTVPGTYFFESHKVRNPDGKTVLLFKNNMVVAADAQCRLEGVYLPQRDGSVHPVGLGKLEGGVGSCESQCVASAKCVGYRVIPTCELVTSEEQIFRSGAPRLHGVVVGDRTVIRRSGWMVRDDVVMGLEKKTKPIMADWEEQCLAMCAMHMQGGDKCVAVDAVRHSLSTDAVICRLFWRSDRAKILTAGVWQKGATHFHVLVGTGRHASRVGAKGRRTVARV